MRFSIYKLMTLSIASMLVLLSCAEMKKPGNEIGHVTRDMTRVIGYGTSELTREIRYGTRETVIIVGKEEKRANRPKSK